MDATVSIELCINALRFLYVRAVRTRSGDSLWFATLSEEKHVRLLRQIAEEIGDARLAKLFVDAQFDSLPETFCLDHFDRSYPPFSICFGEGSLDRYEDYKLRGVFNPSS
ncbi:MAG: hypothetical protein WC910_06705 [Bacteroidales bacterium]|jgi:hypothetical protein